MLLMPPLMLPRRYAALSAIDVAATLDAADFAADAATLLPESAAALLLMLMSCRQPPRRYSLMPFRRASCRLMFHA